MPVFCVIKYKAIFSLHNTDTKIFASNQKTKIHFDEQTIEDLIKDLTHHVGPMASVLVNKAIKNSHDYAELCQHLDEHLPDNEARQRMRQRFDILSSTETTRHSTTNKPASFSDNQLDCLVTTNTSYIGPIAKMLVQRYSKQSESSDELSLRLDEHIESDSEKITFIKDAKTCFYQSHFKTLTK